MALAGAHPCLHQANTIVAQVGNTEVSRVREGGVGFSLAGGGGGNRAPKSQGGGVLKRLN